MRVRIVQIPDGLFRIEKKTLFGWSYVMYAPSLEKAELFAKRVLNPIIKEYST